MSISPFATVATLATERPPGAVSGRAAPGAQSGLAAGEGASSESTTRRHQPGPPPPREVDFTFDDLLDLVNPLHHIPLLGSLYREVTGDTISPHIQVMGSLILGTGAIINAALESQTGDTVASGMYAAAFGTDEEEGATVTQVAQSTPETRGEREAAGAEAERMPFGPPSRLGAGPSMTAEQLVAILPGAAAPRMSGTLLASLPDASRPPGGTTASVGPTITRLRNPEPAAPLAAIQNASATTADPLPSRPSQREAASSTTRQNAQDSRRAEESAAPGARDRRFRTVPTASVHDVDTLMAIQRARVPSVPRAVAESPQVAQPAAAYTPAVSETEINKTAVDRMFVPADGVADAMMRNLRKYQSMQQSLAPDQEPSGET